MSSTTATGSATAAGKAAAGKTAGKGKLVLLASPIVLGLVGGGLWFTGILPDLLGMGHKPAAAKADAAPALPVFVDIPEMVANLNAGARRDAYIKLHVRIQLATEADRAPVTTAMPKLQDLFQTYLREMRPEELRGSTGIWRLREELIARANVAVAPAQVTDVLFTEMLIQ